MLMRLFKKFMSGLSVAILLSACGGGGGGSGDGGPTTTVSYNPNAVSVDCFQNQSSSNSVFSVPNLSVVATFGGTLPTGSVYPVVVLDKAVFNNFIFIRNSSYSYTATFNPIITLAPGIYTGAMALHLYKDSGYTSEYSLSGGTLPYTITVTPELRITVKIDGVVSTTIHPTSSNTTVRSINETTIMWGSSSPPTSVVTLKAGQVLDLESNIPVNWAGPGELPSSVTWDPSSETSTTYHQVIPTLPDGMSPLHDNFFIAMPIPGSLETSQFGAGFNIDVTN